MTAPTLRNLLGYTVLWALNALVGWLALQIAAGAVWGFHTGQAFAEHAAGTAGTLTVIASGLAFWLAANRPRLGREDISALVNEVGAIDARAVLRGWLDGLDAPAPPPLTDEEVTRLARAIVSEMGDAVILRRAEQIAHLYPRALDTQEAARG
jgi:hypothetical protein